MDATTAGALNGAVGDEDDAQTCLYCANLNVLRDLLPPKRCDYCRKWRCQFCTLKFPLLGLRKGLPKRLKGNSRICIQCFGQICQENEATLSGATRHLHGDAEHANHASVPDTQENVRESRGVSFVGRSSMIESERRGSRMDSGLMLGSSRRSSMQGSSIRGSVLESERRESMMVDEMWAAADSFSDSRGLSFVDSSNDNDLTKRPVISKPRYGGLSYHAASFLGLVPSDGPDGTSMNFAISLWMSLFVASILLVIALADGFSLHQRLCYCITTYGIFLALHPWVHADRLSGRTSSKSAEAKRAAKPSTVAPQKAVPVRTN